LILGLLFKHAARQYVVTACKEIRKLPHCIGALHQGEVTMLTAEERKADTKKGRSSLSNSALTTKRKQVV